MVAWGVGRVTVAPSRRGAVAVAVAHAPLTPRPTFRCPKIVNLGTSKTDLFYERKKYGFKKR